MCSAEQPALKAVCVRVCVCLSQPACQTVLIPSEARAHLLSASPLSSLHWFALPSQQPIGSPTCQSEPLVCPRANHMGGNPPVTSQDQTAGTNACECLAAPLATSSPVVLCSRSMSKSWPTRRENKEEGPVSCLGVMGSKTYCLPHVGSLRVVRGRWQYSCNQNIGVSGNQIPKSHI